MTNMATTHPMTPSRFINTLFNIGTFSSEDFRRHIEGFLIFQVMILIPGLCLDGGFVGDWMGALMGALIGGLYGVLAFLLVLSTLWIFAMLTWWRFFIGKRTIQTLDVMAFYIMAYFFNREFSSYLKYLYGMFMMMILVSAANGFFMTMFGFAFVGLSFAFWEPLLEKYLEERLLVVWEE